MPTETRSIVVFLGPTMPKSDAQAILDATYLPPVQQGAVLEATETRPRAIVLIDGYFSWVPSVWHKEILWALDQGIAVYGASSMGALRAAELQAFGMIGHGRVFEDFLHGRLEDDDEVAVVHADGEFDYRPLSDAMVNIRHTLAAAQAEEVISGGATSALVSYCKEQVFYDRFLPKLLRDAARESIVSDDEAERLLAWLPANARDVKRQDAAGLLRLLARRQPEAAPAKNTSFVFQPTANWLQLGASIRARRGLSTASRTPEAADELSFEAVLAECRLAGDWPALEATALARILAATPRFRAGTVSEDEYLTQLARLCVSLGLDDLDQVSWWLRDVGWKPERLNRLVEREALLERARDDCGDDLRETVAELLILRGQDKGYAERALLKRRWLDSAGRPGGNHRDPQDAVAWFRRRVGTQAAESGEMLARRHGWPSAADMADDLLVEYDYCCATEIADIADIARRRDAVADAEVSVPSHHERRRGKATAK